MPSSNHDVTLLLNEMQENVSVLQIKVAALESIVLKDEKARAEYTRLVNEQADVLIRERQSKTVKSPARKTPRA